MANVDLLTGRPYRKILAFSLPLVWGTVFQQLYSLVDSIIVGRFISSALGAVGATYSLNFLIIGFIQGFAVGLGIPLAQGYGAHDQLNVQRYFWNGVYLSIVISIVFGFSMFLATPWLLTIMQTPKSLIRDACLFIQPQFLFIGVTTFYNFSASVLRSFGDSKHPFYFLIIASFTNIILDILFIPIWKWGVIGAAVATIIAQLLSVLLNLLWLIMKSKVIDFHTPQLSFSAKHCWYLSYVALPMGLEYSISAIGAIIMQLAINSLGASAVIAQTAGEKIRQMFTLPMESIGMGMATYVGQNYGAKKIGRIRQGIHDGVWIQLIYSVTCLIVIMISADWLSRVVLGNRPALIKMASLYLRVMSTTFILHGSLMIYRNTLQGLGYSMQAIVSGIGELTGRGLISWITIITASFISVCFINPAAWGLALIYCVVMVNHEIKKS